MSLELCSADADFEGSEVFRNLEIASHPIFVVVINYQCQYLGHLVSGG